MKNKIPSNSFQIDEVSALSLFWKGVNLVDSAYGISKGKKQTQNIEIQATDYTKFTIYDNGRTKTKGPCSVHPFCHLLSKEIKRLDWQSEISNFNF